VASSEGAKRLEVKEFSEKIWFWNLRVAQCCMARCAGQAGYSKTGSGTCALRRTICALRS
ncbi:hypothetical protein A2U01_0051573, partial [Trifolium medium]|nr:hypothetical protein [Trifolium medium]